MPTTDGAARLEALLRRVEGTSAEGATFDDAAFDEAAAQLADVEQREDKFTRAARRLAELERARARAAGRVAANGDPDAAAEAQQFAEQTGLPTDVVQRNLSELRRRRRVNEYDRLLEIPEVRQFLADLDNATVAVDDVENLGVIARTLRTGARVGRTLGAGVIDIGSAIYGGAQFVTEAGAAALDPLGQIGLLPENPLRLAAEYFASQRRRGEALAERVQGDLSDAGFVERSALGGVRSLAQNVPALVGAALTRNPQLALQSLTGIVFGQEYGRARESGLDPAAAAAFAASQAAVEFATERLPVATLFKDLERAGFMRMLANQLATEIPGEQVATLLQDLNSWAALPENANKTLRDFLNERPSAAAETLIATVVAVGGQTSIVAAVDRATRTEAERAERAARARLEAARLAELNRRAAESKLRVRSPERFEAFVEQLAPDASVYVDAAEFENALAQSGIDPDTLPVTIRDQLADAALTDAPIRMSVAEFATHFAGKAGEALIPSVRTTPDAMTLNEANSYAQGEAFSDEVAAELEATEVERAREESAQGVRDRVLAMLEATERFTPAVNSAYAELMARFYEVQAERLGVTPEQLYSELPIHIVAESPLGAAFRQLAPDAFETRPASEAFGDGALEIAGRSAAGDEVARMIVKPRGDVMQIVGVEVDGEFRSGGIDPEAGGVGQQLLVRAWQEAAAQGLPLVSDSSVTVAQLRAYEALRRRGWTIEYADPAEVEDALARGDVTESVFGDGRPVVTRIEPPMLEQRAFHGSPHRFDRFSLQRIGTGEGAQAFGWGLYFAERESVARTYQASLADWTPEGIEVEPGSIEDRAAAYMAEAIDSQSADPYRRAIRNARNFGDEEIAAKLEQWEAAGVEFTRGNLYEVEIPDEAVERMLDWDAPLSEQPENVRAALEGFDSRILGLTGSQRFGGMPTGADIYRRLATQLGSPQAASEALAAAGVPGIKYFDAGSRGQEEGTRNFVLFDDSLVTITSINGEPITKAESDAILQQGGDGQRGAFEPDTRTIALLRNADLSTYLHESGHFFLEALTEMAARENAPQEIRDDVQTVLDWFGVQSLEQWQSMTLEQRREHHEKFARGFEAYLFEGKAPSAELQSLFARFRAWLIQVYRQLRALNVELTDEVRGVFDRMLATDAEIRAREALRAYAPIFESAEQAGMTPEEFAEYQQLGDEATQSATEELQRRTLRDMRWFSNAKGRELRRLQKDATAKRKALREEARKQVEAEPVYQALRFLRTGEVTVEGEEIKAEAGHKLDVAALERMYPAGELGALDWSPLRRRRLAGRDGLHPDTVAEIFGFSSGDHLVRALLEAEPIADVIEARTDQLMLERYGDITDPVALERAAEAAIANDTRARFLAREVAALAKAFGTWPAIARAANAYARESIARKRIRDIRPGQYRNAEAKASREADAALKRADTAGAAAAKRAQLLANRMTRTAAEAIDEIERGLRYLRKFDNESTRKSINPDYRDQIDSLLERHDLRKSVSQRDLERRKSLLEWIEAQREAGFEPTIDEALLNEARRKHYKDLTLEEFRGLVDAVKNIEHLGRLKRRLLTAKDQREFEAAVAEAAASIEANATRVIVDKVERESSAWARFLQGAGEWLTTLRKFSSVVREMDGSKDGGVMWELFVRPLNEAADREATMRAEASQRLAELFKPIRKLREKLYIPAIDQSLSREARLAVALNWGNETNRQRIIEGNRWTPDQVQAILDTLTREEWDFVQGVWDFVDSYWPQIAAKERRVTGVEPPKVEATPVQTKFGEFRGGYYPIKYDPRRSSRAEGDSAAEILSQMMRGAYTRATTRRGHTKHRVQTVQRPVKLDFDVLFQHIEQVTHDLAFHEVLIDTNRLLRAPAIDQAIRRHYGPDVLRLMRRTLEDVAIGEVAAQDATERLANHLRVGATIVGLGLNLTTAMLQVTGVSQSIVRIGPRWFGRGLAQFTARPATMIREVHAKSEFMRNRGRLLNRELGEIRNRLRGENRLAALYFLPIQAMQTGVDVPTWLGAYAKAVHEGHDDARAVALADQAVLDSQGGGAIKDLAEVQRGSAWKKLWTNFYSYFSVTYQLSAESLARYRAGPKADPANIAKLAADFLLLYSVPAVLGLLIRDGLKGDIDDDWEELLQKLAREHLAYLIGVFPYFREIGAAMQGYDYSGPSGGKFFAELNRFWQQAEQGEVDEALLRAANQVAGTALHYPAAQVQRSYEGMHAALEGDAPLSAIMFGPPKED